MTAPPAAVSKNKKGWYEEETEDDFFLAHAVDQYSKTIVGVVKMSKVDYFLFIVVFTKWLWWRNWKLIDEANIVQQVAV